jgi:hypothetical protein
MRRLRVQRRLERAVACVNPTRPLILQRRHPYVRRRDVEALRDAARDRINDFGPNLLRAVDRNDQARSVRPHRWAAHH